MVRVFHTCQKLACAGWLNQWVLFTADICISHDKECTTVNNNIRDDFVVLSYCRNVNVIHMKRTSFAETVSVANLADEPGLTIQESWIKQLNRNQPLFIMFVKDIMFFIQSVYFTVCQQGYGTTMCWHGPKKSGLVQITGGAQIIFWFQKQCGSSNGYLSWNKCCAMATYLKRVVTEHYIPCIHIHRM